MKGKVVLTTNFVNGFLFRGERKLTFFSFGQKMGFAFEKTKIFLYLEIETFLPFIRMQ